MNLNYDLLMKISCSIIKFLILIFVIMIYFHIDKLNKTQENFVDKQTTNCIYNCVSQTKKLSPGIANPEDKCIYECSRDSGRF